jgi:hypothetical protein
MAIDEDNARTLAGALDVTGAKGIKSDSRSKDAAIEGNVAALEQPMKIGKYSKGRITFNSLMLALVAATLFVSYISTGVKGSVIAHVVAPAGPQPIHGYVHTTLSSDAASALGVTSVAVPDIVVAAKNITTGLLSQPSQTDPYGYFRTPALDPGSYNICVSGTGYIDGCDPQVITISDHVHVMDHDVMIGTKQQEVTGTVLLADNLTPCFWYNLAFDANSVLTAKVTLIAAGGTVVAGPVRGNNLGQYVMPTGAAPGTYTVAVDCEAEHAENAVSLSTGPAQQMFVLSNTPPTAGLIEAANAGIGVRRAGPGDSLTLTVTSADADNDALHYRWVDESGSTPEFPDAATVNWSAPAQTGPHTLRVLVSDGRGGHAISRTVINVGPDEMHFSGVVFDRATRAAVAGASISLDGVMTTTDATGNFQVTVPDTARFVLNVNKPGYALTSRIFYARATGIQVPLDSVQTAPVDAAAGGTVTFQVTGCTPMEDGSASDSSNCAKQEIGTLKLVFGPGSLVSGDGVPFTGTATIEGFQYDLTLPNAIPGDQSATYRGADTRLQTFGSFHVTPRDPAGNRLQMAPGMAVAVSMPIHPLALASAPTTIPFFSYDESTGLWVEHGELTRADNNYVGKILHFSEFNADSIGGRSACMKVQLDQEGNGFPRSVVLNANYLFTDVGRFMHPDTEVDDTDQPIGIVQLVPNQDFYLEIRDTATRTVLQRVLLNSGPLLPADTTFPVPPPYNGCKPAVIFNNTSIPPTTHHFLIEGTIPDNSDNYKHQTTTGIYAAFWGRDTLVGWLTTNGFGDGATETHAVYFNDGDLKFGRSMHCRDVSHAGTRFSQDWVACYVSNFGSVGDDLSTQPNLLQDAYNNLRVVATVAMEWHPDQHPNEVQFWAFNGRGDYFPNPPLDTEGGKPMPNTCMGCHQGFYGGAGQLVNNAKFLPFDVESFRGDDNNPLQNTLGGGGHRPTQGDFRQLNQFVLRSVGGDSTDPATVAAAAAYQSLMDLWYKDTGHSDGVNNATATFHFGQGAAGLTDSRGASIFPDHQPLYNNVVKPVCRTCHIARTPGDAGDTWDRLSQFTGPVRVNSIQSNVCGREQHFMPHAEVPYKHFWQLNLGSTLASQLGTGGCAP